MSGAAGPGGDRTLIALISDEDTATGLLLAGIGHISGAAAGGTGGRSNENGVGKGSSGTTTGGAGTGGSSNNDNMMGDSEKAQKVLEQCREKNFFIVNSTTTIPEIESAFHSFTQEREDVAILLITQPLAEKIRQVCDRYTQAFPAVLEIPSKDAPYDPSKDSILKRVQKLFGE